jgi:DNA repair exonuclease SbcCD ATPase subunit
LRTARERSDFSAQAVEPSIRASPHSSGFKNDPFASDRRSFGRLALLTLASFFMAGLIGVGAIIAWQSNGISATKSPGNVAEQTASVPGGAATSSELAQQFDVMARDLAVMRNSVEQLTAKQEQLTQDITTVADKQEQMAQSLATLAAKQEQIAQDIAAVQTIEQNITQNLSSPPLTQAVPLPPRKPVARTSSVPRLVAPSPSTLPRNP